MNGLVDMSRWGMPNSPVGFGNEFSSVNPFAAQGGGVTSLGMGGGGLGNLFGDNGLMGSLRSSGFLGTDGNQGWGGMALGALGDLGNAFMSMQNYGFARDALNRSQEQFSKNYAAQRDTLNTQMEDRQRARVAANSGSESVDSYMARNRIK